MVNFFSFKLELQLLACYFGTVREAVEKFIELFVKCNKGVRPQRLWCLTLVPSHDNLEWIVDGWWVVPPSALPRGQAPHTALPWQVPSLPSCIKAKEGGLGHHASFFPLEVQMQDGKPTLLPQACAASQKGPPDGLLPWGIHIHNIIINDIIKLLLSLPTL